MDTFEAIKDLHLFARKLILKSLHTKPLSNSDLSKQESKALDDLVSKLEDQEHKDLIDNIDLESFLAAHTTPTIGDISGKSILKKKSNQFPSLSLNSNLQAFIAMTTKEIQSLNINQSPINISDKERRALELLSNQY